MFLDTRVGLIKDESQTVMYKVNLLMYNNVVLCHFYDRLWHLIRNNPKYWGSQIWANSVDPDQTASDQSTLFANHPEFLDT